MEKFNEAPANKKYEEKNESQPVSQDQNHQNPSPSLEILQMQIVCNQGGFLCKENEEELIENVEPEFHKNDGVPVESDAKKFELGDKGGVFSHEIKEEPVKGVKTELFENSKALMQLNPEKIEAFEESYFLNIEDIQKGEKSDVEMMKEAELKSCQSLATSLEIQKLESSIPSKKFDLTYCRNMIGSLWYLNASSPDIECTIRICDYYVEKSCFVSYALNDKNLLRNVEEIASHENWCDKEARKNLNVFDDNIKENVSCDLLCKMQRLRAEDLKVLQNYKNQGVTYVNKIFCFKNGLKKEGIGVVYVFCVAGSKRSMERVGYCDLKDANIVIELFEPIESYNFVTEVKIFDPGISKQCNFENLKHLIEMLKCKKQGGAAVKFFKDINNCEFVKICMKKEKRKTFDPGIVKSGRMKL